MRDNTEDTLVFHFLSSVTAAVSWPSVSCVSYAQFFVAASEAIVIFA